MSAVQVSPHKNCTSCSGLSTTSIIKLCVCVCLHAWLWVWVCAELCAYSNECGSRAHCAGLCVWPVNVWVHMVISATLGTPLCVYVALVWACVSLECVRFYITVCEGIHMKEHTNIWVLLHLITLWTPLNHTMHAHACVWRICRRRPCQCTNEWAQ